MMINEFWQVRLGGSVPPAFPNLLSLGFDRLGRISGLEKQQIDNR